MRVYICKDKRVEYILAGGLENFWSMKPPLSFGVFIVSSVNETSMDAIHRRHQFGALFWVSKWRLFVWGDAPSILDHSIWFAKHTFLSPSFQNFSDLLKGANW